MYIINTENPRFFDIIVHYNRNKIPAADRHMKASIDILSREEDLGKSEYYHEILTRGQGFEASKQRVLRFIKSYKLVNYSRVDVLEKESLPASSSDFEVRLRGAIHKNRQLLHALLEEVRSDGFIKIQDLQEMPQGHGTKIFHVITHILDGKFGLDSHFYNLEEDSHWVSETLLQKIKTAPSDYWILAVKAQI